MTDRPRHLIDMIINILTSDDTLSYKRKQILNLREAVGDELLIIALVDAYVMLGNQHP